jgi:hypothetical protein
MYGNDSVSKGIVEATDIIRGKERYRADWFAIFVNELHSDHEPFYHL